MQEALTNTLRYSGPGTAVTVAVRIGADATELTVIDDGLGSAAGRATAASSSGGNGLLGMRERVAVHGGEFTAGPRLAGGWQVSARLPAKGSDLNRPAPAATTPATPMPATPVTPNEVAA